jgi:hypothetical protein
MFKLESLTFISLTVLLISLGAVNGHETYKCLQLPNYACIDNGNFEIGKDNIQPSLAGSWSFDDLHASDGSGYNNDMFPPPAVGPAFGGNGYSAKFNYSNYSVIENIHAYETNEFTIQFWIYLLSDSVGVWRTILHKGDTLTELTPTIQLWPDSNRLHVRVSTQASWNEGLDSFASLPMGRWTHVAVVVTNQLLQLYVNGQLDTQTVLEGPVVINQGPIYVGGDPWHPAVGCFLDDLQFYRSAQSTSDFISIVQQFVPFYGTEVYAVLGCPSCNYYEAVNSCPASYQLCSMQQLYVGGYWMTRIMGWFNNNNDLWVRVNFNEVSMNARKEFLDPNVYKMGVCCQI